MTGSGADGHFYHSLPSFVRRPLQWIGRLAYVVGWPVIHLILEGSERTRLVVLSSNRSCLVVQPYIGSGTWKLPGGGMSRGETPPATAARELFEEVGLRVAAEHFALLGTMTMTEDGHRYRAHVLAVYVAQPPKLTLQWCEIAAARWLPLETVLAMLDDMSVRQAAQVWAEQ